MCSCIWSGPICCHSRTQHEAHPAHRPARIPPASEDARLLDRAAADPGDHGREHRDPAAARIRAGRRRRAAGRSVGAIPAGDRTGGRARTIRNRCCARLSIYAQEYDLHPPGAPHDWATHSLWYSDAEAESFAAWGGIDAALALLKPSLPPNASPFKTPPHYLHLVPFPEGIQPNLPTAQLDTLVPPYLKGEPNVPTADGPRRAIAAVVLPETLGPGHPGWEMWTNGGVNATIIQLLADTIRQQNREQALEAGGLDAAAVAAIEAQDTAPHVNSPKLGGTVSTNAIRQLIPVGSAWLLWMTIMMVSNVLLHGLIEERSNKLIESLLATVTAQELMSGKLLGVAGIGFTIAVTWTVFAVASVGFAPADLALVLRPALEPYASVAAVLGLVFYFVTGYLAIATLFLVIGSMSDSMHDAQAYMTPLIVILLAPLVMIRPAMADPHGLLPVIMSWIPIYTPFVMLAGSAPASRRSRW
ncbi:MAG: ABC transporter permease [Aliidongia sp.]